MTEKGRRDAERTELGLLGGHTITDTSEHTDDEWFCLVPIGDCVIASITRPDFTPATSTDLSPTGPLYGRITSLTLTSGACDLLY